jgi:choline dehydrogenase-like flavoprotein
MKTGNLTLRPWSIVVKVIYDKDTKLAKGVEVLDAETNKTYEYFAKVVFLNASTINTAAILMNSATDVWPEGLGSSGGALGHNIMDHHLNVGASGTVEGYEDKYYYGRRANGIYVPRYRNLNGEKRDYIRGFGYQGSAGRERWSRNIPEMNIGGDFKDALSEPGNWTMGIGGFGETLPYHENRMWLDKTKKDKWGLPVPVIDAVVRDNEKKMRVDMMNDAAEMLEAAGVKNIYKYQDEAVLGKGIHEMGTARMGRDPKTSVLNGFNQVWDAKNVYVTDGAAMTSAACQNPSLTYMALTARAADHAVSELKKMNI